MTTESTVHEPHTTSEAYRKLATAAREQLAERHNRTLEAQRAAGSRVLYYLSAEHLPGRQLDQNLLALGEQVGGPGGEVGAVPREVEVEPPLGNGGQARLTSCVLESAATLDLPVVGYGLRYAYGTRLSGGALHGTGGDGDGWALTANPWEMEAPQERRTVAFGGHTEDDGDPTGLRRRWVSAEQIDGVPSTMFMPGFGTGTVNAVRFWRAHANPTTLDPERLEAGEYATAVEQAARAENLTRVYYPDEATEPGRELRLKQQYFLVACTLGEIVDRYRERYAGWRAFPAAVAIQLNETHPALAAVELMRLLVDEQRVDWDRAWSITTKVFGYTVHSLLPEALQTWPVWLMQQLLPRHMEIIYSINHFLLQDVAVRFPGDIGKLGALSLIQEGAEQHVRMAHLGVVTAAHVNGVAEQHTALLTRGALRGFATMWPKKFCTVTNGVNPRRFLRLANPRLSTLITEHLGSQDWVRDADRLIALAPLADDPDFRAVWRGVRRANKERLSALTSTESDVTVDPESMCDVMIKKFHEYKRQLLKALHVVTLYNRILADPTAQAINRTVVFAGQADPGYHPGRQTMRLVTAIAATVNHDPLCDGRLRVVYLPDYTVTASELIAPAADLSEQISVAGMEASGTGNMKLALNGALTVATLDGANFDLQRRIGTDSVTVFGLDAARATRLRGSEAYQPTSYYESDGELRAALDAITSGAFSDGDGEAFAPIVDRILGWDPYLALADYRAYVDAQDQLEKAWADVETWTRTSILTTARCGYFSSDRTVRQYNESVWRLSPVAVSR